MDDVNNMFGGDADPVDVTEVVGTVVEQVVEPVVEPQLAEPAAEKPQVPEGYVPLHVVKELRDEIRSLRQPQVQPVETPQEELYPDEDTLKIVNNSQWNQKREFSRILAEDKFGEEVVKTAHEWAFNRCANDPAFNLAVSNASHPYKFIIEEHRKSQAMQELGNIDPDQIKAFKQWQQAQSQLATQAAVPVITPTAPPRSIASEASAGGNTAPPKVSQEEVRLNTMF